MPAWLTTTGRFPCSLWSPNCKRGCFAGSPTLYQCHLQFSSSTQEALISLTQRWHEHLDEGGSTLCVFLDLSKAFDSVPHSGVTNALAAASVSSQALGWVADYLTGRLQYMALGTSSPLVSVTSGVPQGSILGPLLFLAAFNGIFNHHRETSQGMPTMPPTRNDHLCRRHGCCFMRP